MRPLRSLRFSLLLLTALAFGCSRDLTLPTPGSQLQLLDFKPRAAFSGDAIVVTALNFQPAGNSLTFPGGAVALAHEGLDGGDLLVDGGLVFTVPEGLQSSGPLFLSNAAGRSPLSTDTFSPLGIGHPNFGTPVSQLRFRLDPVGLVDQPENVLMGASSLDLVLTDAKAFRRVPGRPLAMLRAAKQPTHAFVSVRTSAGSVLLEVKTSNGDTVGSSVDNEVRELFLMPPDGAVPDTIVRSVGIDPVGRTWLTQWQDTAGVLTPKTRKLLPFSQILGAAALEGTVVVVARGSTSQTYVPAVYSLSGPEATKLWEPMTGSGCTNDVGTEPLCRAPDGPITVVRSSMNAMDPHSVVVSLTSGDLLVLKGSAAPVVITLISYAGVSALVPGGAPGKVLFTKSHDGAVFQYDLATQAQDWAVQLRGEPTVIDVNTSIDEIAIGNRAENAVDTVALSTGLWTGRIAFDMGLGSANGMRGGIVAPYSYDPAKNPTGALVLERMDLLLRNVGVVVSINASSLEVFEHAVLDTNAGEPLRLAVTNDFETLVVHQRKLGLLERNNAGLRVERIVTLTDIPTPVDLHVLPSGAIVIQTIDTVRLFTWSNGRLISSTELPMPANTTLLATATSGEQVVVVWRGPRGFGGGFYDKSGLVPGGVPVKALSFAPELAQFLGLVQLRTGPAALFGRKGGGGPAALPFAALQGDGVSVPSVISRTQLGVASPDGRFLLWLDQGADQPMARLIRADVEDAFRGYSTYRLGGNAAGPDFDPSGQWLFLPIPLLDELDVVQ